MKRSAVWLWTIGFALLVAGWLWIMTTEQPVFADHNREELEVQGMIAPLVPTSTLIVPATSTAPTSTTPHVDKPRRLVRDPIPFPGERVVTVPVLMYHYVRPLSAKFSPAGNLLSVSPEHFAAQMHDLLDHGYQSITPDELHDAINGTGTLPSKPVLITFDDGYRDQYMNAFPVLYDLHIKATFFIITDYVAGYQAYMDTVMMKAMERAGVATISSHTRTHAMLGKLPIEKQHEEIFESKKSLETLLEHPVTSFAYPYGSFTTTTVQLVKDAGYTVAFSTIPGSKHVPHAEFELRRIRVLDRDAVVPLIERYSK